jgi:hypothetical protein
MFVWLMILYYFKVIKKMEKTGFVQLFFHGNV